MRARHVQFPAESHACVQVLDPNRDRAIRKVREPHVLFAAVNDPGDPIQALLETKLGQGICHSCAAVPQLSRACIHGAPEPVSGRGHGYHAGEPDHNSETRECIRGSNRCKGPRPCYSKRRRQRGVDHFINTHTHTPFHAKKSEPIVSASRSGIRKYSARQTAAGENKLFPKSHGLSTKRRES